MSATVEPRNSPAEAPSAIDRAMDDPEGFFADGVSDEVLRIQLDNFEGPFEVLLYLIRSQEIDIFDIPIVKVTEQYLRFLDLIATENIDVAGEFLVMAATLIQIKARMILPVDTVDEEEEVEEEDPRLELVEKLLEYRRYRDLAQALGERETAAGNSFGRSVKPQVEVVEDEQEYLELSLYDLIKAIRSILRFLSEAAVHQITGEGASIEEKIEWIEQALAERDSVTWTELFHACRSRVEIVCCLLAILELCRMSRIRAHQHRSFGDIRIFARNPEEIAPEWTPPPPETAADSEVSAPAPQEPLPVSEDEEPSMPQDDRPPARKRARPRPVAELRVDMDRPPLPMPGENIASLDMECGGCDAVIEEQLELDTSAVEVSPPEAAAVSPPDRGFLGRMLHRVAGALREWGQTLRRLLGVHGR